MERFFVGALVGPLEGTLVGSLEGILVGSLEGNNDGALVFTDGLFEEKFVGLAVLKDGRTEGSFDGFCEGLKDEGRYSFLAFYPADSAMKIFPAVFPQTPKG
jgi:hypothetical protein